MLLALSQCKIGSRDDLYIQNQGFYLVANWETLIK